MNSNVTFDRLKLSLPAKTVSILQPELFVTSITGDGEILWKKYEQSEPFYYSLFIDCRKESSVVVEFNGKVLLESYPDLISRANITQCFDNINRFRVCYINPDEAVEQAYVVQCDVTRDIATPSSIKEIRLNLTLRNSNKWCIRESTSNRFTLENTSTTPRMKTRMIIYDKGIEMSRKPNEPFLRSVSNADYQRDYFSNKIRYELSLRSGDRICIYFKTEDARLTTIFESTVDPILTILEQTIVSDELNRAANYAGSLRDLGHLLILTACNYDLTKLELVIRDIYGTSRSITRALKPYQELLSALRETIPEPDKDLPLLDLRNHLRYILSKTFCPDADSCHSNNLLELYQNSVAPADNITTEIEFHLSEPTTCLQQKDPRISTDKYNIKIKH